MLSHLAALAMLADEPKVTLEMIAPVKVSDGGPIFFAVAITPEPGWHSYWKNPGDSGAPPALTWDLPQGWKADPLNFPPPTRFAIGDSVNYGYDRKTILTGVIHPAPNATKSPFKLTGKLNWMACDDESCVAGVYEVGLNGSIGATTSLDPKADEQYNAASRAIPTNAAKGSATFAKGSYTLEAEASSPIDAYFFSDTEGTVAHELKQKVTKTADKIRIEIPISPFAKEPVKQLRGVLLTQGRDHVGYQIVNFSVQFK